MFWFQWSWPTRIWTLILTIFVGLILFPVFGRAKYNTGHHSCQSNLKQLGLGLLQYVQDYDEKMPPVASNHGWANSIQPYVKTTSIYYCPTVNWDRSQPNPNLTGYIDYFYNSQLQRREQKSLGDVSRLIMAADGNDGQELTTAAYAKPGIPPLWRTDSTSPAYRHLDTANYLFADGHVKSSNIDAISNDWASGKYFFQPLKLHGPLWPIYIQAV